MSPEEVILLDLRNRPIGIDNCVFNNSGESAENYDPDVPISFDPFFQLKAEEMVSEKNHMLDRNSRHVDYLANNIIHIMKVGFRAGYDRTSTDKMNVCDAITIGSDFDGMTDPINLPKLPNGDIIDPENFVTAAKFDKLRIELDFSLKKFLQFDPEIKAFVNLIPADLLEKICVDNGWKFLNKHFQPPAHYASTTSRSSLGNTSTT